MLSAKERNTREWNINIFFFCVQSTLFMGCMWDSTCDSCRFGACLNHPPLVFIIGDNSEIYSVLYYDVTHQQPHCSPVDLHTSKENPLLSIMNFHSLIIQVFIKAAAAFLIFTTYLIRNFTRRHTFYGSLYSTYVRMLPFLRACQVFCISFCSQNGLLLIESMLCMYEWNGPWP